jgi:hypothetical protein
LERTFQNDRKYVLSKTVLLPRVSINYHAAAYCPHCASQAFLLILLPILAGLSFQESKQAIQIWKTSPLP